MTVIKYKRTGGVMGQDMTVDFDLDELPANISQRLHNLILESDFFALPVQDVGISRPDEFEYTVIVMASNSIHTIRTTDTSMPEALRPLIEDLTELAKASER